MKLARRFLLGLLVVAALAFALWALSGGVWS